MSQRLASIPCTLRTHVSTVTPHECPQRVHQVRLEPCKSLLPSPGHCRWRTVLKVLRPPSELTRNAHATTEARTRKASVWRRLCLAGNRRITLVTSKIGTQSRMFDNDG
eukprot:TRINITY_DN2694_c0_g1_i18.p2 TRINITY_DN2694_c0_g1~~TRINITY_DN2694_c0_g1_i18.p2  ORF type:complete len:109 (+),score=4.44 TRINITY_DN2694_c0_g1_i18:352-678(+)